MKIGELRLNSDFLIISSIIESVILEKLEGIVKTYNKVRNSL